MYEKDGIAPYYLDQTEQDELEYLTLQEGNFGIDPTNLSMLKQLKTEVIRAFKDMYGNYLPSNLKEREVTILFLHERNEATSLFYKEWGG